jgi:hypothetical protein
VWSGSRKRRQGQLIDRTDVRINQNTRSPSQTDMLNDQKDAIANRSRLRLMTNARRLSSPSLTISVLAKFTYISTGLQNLRSLGVVRAGMVVGYLWSRHFDPESLGIQIKLRRTPGTRSRERRSSGFPEKSILKYANENVQPKYLDGQSIYGWLDCDCIKATIDGGYRWIASNRRVHTNT